MPPASALEMALALIEEKQEPVTRSHLLGIAPASYVRAVAAQAGPAGVDPDPRGGPPHVAAGPGRAPLRWR
jgi:hypothetical protein